MHPSRNRRLGAVLLAAFGSVQAIAQSAPPTLTGAGPGASGLDARPAGGNVTASPAAGPANVAGFNPASDEGALTVLAVAINGEGSGDTIVIVRDGQTLVPIDDLNRWRLVFSGQPVMIDGQAFGALSGVRGLTFRIDKALQQLQITVPADAFLPTAISGERQYLPPSRAARTAFVNYDVSLQRAAGRMIGNAFLETGASDDRGLIENTMTIGNDPAGPNVVRLDTFAIHDNPSGLTRLTIGDTLTHISSWEQPVRFGGIKWGTDFSVQPGFLSFPTPIFNGQAALPSNVQLYINDVLNYQGQVREGPFSLNRLPVVSGAGDVSIVVRDALGVEHRVTSSYYVSIALLRPGLSDFSIEAGAERDHYGRRSFDYRRPFVAGFYRHGLTSSLTVETRGEGAAHLQNVGAGLAALLGTFGEIGVAASGSRGRNGAGHLYRIYASRISQHWSLSFSYQAASRDYAQLGQARGAERPREILQATAGATFKHVGSFTANLSYLRLRDGTRTQVRAFNYNRQLGAFGYLNAFALRTSSYDGHPDSTLGAGITIPLGQRRSALVQIDSDNRRIELQRTRPDDNGWGYRLAASEGKIDQQEAELAYRGQAVDLTANIARFKGRTAERLLASGGFVLSGSSILPTRRLNESFAIVDVGNGEKGVRIFQENRKVATTNGAGIAMVTNLRPYEANRLSVAAEDFKLDSTIPSDTLIVVPRFLSGVQARFHVASGHAGTVLIVLPDGRPLEPGTMLSFSDGDRLFYAAFDGEVFIDNISEGKILVAKREAGPCRVTIRNVPKGIELPRIGPLTCQPQESAK
ncbi:MAG TPA: fimbria/pilus outer membrane usher protein [Sphingomonas sp.]|nr:fimbria/pilus outer membrane usher protein [Sphingomonas sp.]